MRIIETSEIIYVFVNKIENVYDCPLSCSCAVDYITDRFFLIIHLENSWQSREKKIAAKLEGQEITDLSYLYNRTPGFDI